MLLYKPNTPIEQLIANFHISMPEGQTLSPLMFGVIPCEYVGESYVVSGLFSCEEGIILRSFVLTQYWRVTDGQTEFV